MSRLPVIAVIDSGIGGLSILQAIHTRFPTAQYIYAADNLNFPWGGKTESEIALIMETLTRWVIAHYHPDVVVVACNTASTVVLKLLRQMFSCPFVGVVPAIKPACALTKTKVVGLLATEGTVRRPYTDQLIQEFAQGCTVLKIGSQRLVEIAEGKAQGKRVDLKELTAIIHPFLNEESQVDTVVLGCTHFPFLLEELKSLTPVHFHWVDSSHAVANRVGHILAASQHTTLKNTGTMPNVCLFSDLPAVSSELIDFYRSFGFTEFNEILTFKTPAGG